MKVSLVLCAVLASSLAACKGGGSGSEASGSGTAATQAGPRSVTIWWAQWAPADGLQDLARQYQTETGVAVKVHQIPWASYQDQVFLNFGGDTTDFDIVVGDSQWLGRGATSKLYLDLTDWLPTVLDLKTIHPAALKYLCEYPSGTPHYFAAPCETDAVGFAYRKDWFEDPAEKAAFHTKYRRDLVPPGNWDEFRDIAEFFTRPKAKRYGTAILTGRGYDALVMGYQPFLWDWGGSWGDSSTFAVKGVLDARPGADALQFMKQLLRFAPNDGSNMDYGKVLEAFTSGSVAMAMNYFAFYPTIVRSMGPKAGFFVVPEKDGKRFTSLGGQGMSISTKVPPARQKLAKDFIAWFLAKSNQERWITKEAGFTATVDILNSPAFMNATPYNKAFSDSMALMRDFWNVPPYNELLASAAQHLGEALDGAKSPDQALGAIAEEHERILREGGFRK